MWRPPWGVLDDDSPHAITAGSARAWLWTRAVRSLVGALQVGIVDARQLADVSKDLGAPRNLIKSAQLTLGLPSKPLPNLPRPEAIRER